MSDPRTPDCTCLINQSTHRKGCAFAPAATEGRGEWTGRPPHEIGLDLAGMDDPTGAIGEAIDLLATWQEKLDPPAVEQAEPVAWRFRRSSNARDYSYSSEDPGPHARYRTPLYTHPPATDERPVVPIKSLAPGPEDSHWDKPANEMRAEE